MTQRESDEATRDAPMELLREEFAKVKLCDTWFG